MKKILSIVVVVVLLVNLTWIDSFAKESESIVNNGSFWSPLQNGGFGHEATEWCPENKWNKDILEGVEGYVPDNVTVVKSITSYIDMWPYNLAIDKGDIYFTASYDVGKTSTFGTAESKIQISSYLNQGTILAEKNYNPSDKKWDNDISVEGHITSAARISFTIGCNHKAIIKDPTFILDDRGAPNVLEISLQAEIDEIQEGDEILFEVEFDENVKSLGSANEIYLTLGNGITAQYKSGSGDYRWLYSYVVTEEGLSELQKGLDLFGTMDNTKIADVIGAGNQLNPVSDMAINKANRPDMEDKVIYIEKSDLTTSAFYYNEVLSYYDLLMLYNDQDGDKIYQFEVVDGGELRVGGYVAGSSISEIYAMSHLTAFYMPQYKFESDYGDRSREFTYTYKAVEDTAARLESDPGIGTIRIISNPVAKNGSIYTGVNQEYGFTLADFTNNFSFDERQPIQSVTIVSLPDVSQGTLVLEPSNSVIQVGDIIARDMLDRIVFKPAVNVYGQYTMGWTGTDDKGRLSTVGYMNIVINEPDGVPPVITGYIDIDITDESEYTFKLSDFTEFYLDSNAPIGSENKGLEYIVFETLPEYGSIETTNPLVAESDRIIKAGTFIHYSDIQYLVYKVNDSSAVLDGFKWFGTGGAYYSNVKKAWITLDSSLANWTPVVTEFEMESYDLEEITMTRDQLLSHYSDKNDDPLTSIRISQLPEAGNLVYKGSAVTKGQIIDFKDFDSMIYQPGNGDIKSLRVTWEASDGTVYSDSANINIELKSVNTPPTMEALKVYAYEGIPKALSKDLFINSFSDIDGDSMTMVRFLAPASGDLQLLMDGQVVYVSPDNPLEVAVEDIDKVSLLLSSTGGPYYYYYQVSDNSNTFMSWSESYMIEVGFLWRERPVMLAEHEIYIQRGELYNLQFSDFEEAMILQDEFKHRISMSSLNQDSFFKLKNVENYDVVNVQNYDIHQDVESLLYIDPSLMRDKELLIWIVIDEGDYTSSMGLCYLVVVDAYSQPITQDINISLDEDNQHQLTKTLFKTNYSNEKPMKTIRIDSYPTKGDLKLVEIVNSQETYQDVSVQQIIKAEQLDKLVYIPDKNANGSDSFQWSGYNNYTYSVPSNVNINIQSVNDKPLVTSFEKGFYSGNSVVIGRTDFRQNVTDVEGSISKIQIVSLPEYGDLTLYDSKVFLDVITGIAEIELYDLDYLKYVPIENKMDSFTFRADDGEDLSEPGTVTLNLIETCWIQDMGIDLDEDDHYKFLLSEFEACVDDKGGSLQSIKITELPVKGVLVLDGNSVALGASIAKDALDGLVFIAEENQHGSDSFSWTCYDGVSDSKPASVNLNIMGVYDEPTVVDINFKGSEDKALEISLQAFVDDYHSIENSSMTKIIIKTLPENARLEFNSVFVASGDELMVKDFGELVLVPDPDWYGVTSFEYSVFDEVMESNQAAVNIELSEVNDVPQVRNVNKNLTMNTVLTFSGADFENVFADVDGDSLVEVTIESLPESYQGRLLMDQKAVFEGDSYLLGELGKLEFVPEANYLGRVNFKFTCSDGSAVSDEGLVDILVFDPNAKVTEFVESLYTVRVSSEPAGVASFSGYGTGFSDGEAYKVAVTGVTDGYKFVRWSGGSASGSVSGADVALVAVFEKVEPVVDGKLVDLVDEDSPLDIGDSDDYYSDLGSYLWAVEDINFLTFEEIISGRGDKMYAPGENVTRAEFTAYLVNLMGVYDEDALEFFDDVDELTEYYQHIASGYEAGLIEGYSVEAFGPENYISREDIMTIMMRLLNSKYGEELLSCMLEELPFDDRLLISDYARHGACVAFMNGLIEGDEIELGDGNVSRVIRAKDFMNRAEVAVVIKRLYDLFE